MAAKLILYIAASLDSYIATTDHSVDWLEREEYIIPNEDFGYHNFIKTIGTTLMGRKTFNFVENYDGPFPYPDLKNYVFSRTRSETHEHVEFISDPVPEFVRKLKASAEKDIWLIGGGGLNCLLLEQDLIDRIILTVVPEFLGDGIPLWPDKTGPKRFTLTDSQSYSNGFVQLQYDKAR